MSQPDRSAYDVVAAYLQLAPSDRRAVKKLLPGSLRAELKALAKPAPTQTRALRGLSAFIVDRLNDDNLLTPATRRAVRETIASTERVRA